MAAQHRPRTGARQRGERAAAAAGALRMGDFGNVGERVVARDYDRRPPGAAAIVANARRSERGRTIPCDWLSRHWKRLTV